MTATHLSSRHAPLARAAVPFLALSLIAALSGCWAGSPSPVAASHARGNAPAWDIIVPVAAAPATGFDDDSATDREPLGRVRPAGDRVVASR